MDNRDMNGTKANRPNDYDTKSLVVLFGLKIRSIRLQMSLSQDAFADEIGFHRTYLGQIERAEKNISLKGIERICKALKINPKDLFDFTDIL